MTALILVVDDIPSNVKLLEVKLTDKYYQVLTANSGQEALKIAEEKQPDIILLDIMMPGMDGFETCQRLKKNYATMHILIIIVTALSDIEDKIQGLSCGADEFLIKPIDEFSLFNRIKSLLRFKLVIDELRLRINTNAQIGTAEKQQILQYVEDIKTAKISVIDHKKFPLYQVKKSLLAHFTNIACIESHSSLDDYEDSDLFIINLSINIELLKTCSLLKSRVKTRLSPILAIIEDDEDHDFIKEIMELGINDYIVLPLNENEFIARVTTQIKRKKYQDAIEKSMDDSLKMAIIDPLTTLYNRHYFKVYINELLTSIQNTNKSFSLIMFDIDNFKNINDQYGHLSGDLILQQFSNILKKGLRVNDLTVRYGGEEFLIILFNIPLKEATLTAQRIKNIVAETQFEISGSDNIKISATISGGVTEFKRAEEIENTIARADQSLYEAKNGGRNKILSQ